MQSSRRRLLQLNYRFDFFFGAAFFD